MYVHIYVWNCMCVRDLYVRLRTFVYMCIWNVYRCVCGLDVCEVYLYKEVYLCMKVHL